MTVSRHASNEGDAGRSWPVWVLVAVVVALAVLYLPPLTRGSTAADLCVAAAGDESNAVRWSLAPLPLPHWECAIDGTVIDLGWWPVSN